MAALQNDPRAGTDPSGLATGRPPRPGRPIAVAAAVVFVISAAFPVAAGLSRDTASFPRWWGAVDVGVAFVLAALAMAVMALAHGRTDKGVEDASYRAYRVLIHGIFAMLLVFFLLGDRIIWVNCLTGLAWRYWLLLYSLPSWLAVLGATRASPGRSEGGDGGSGP
jgi:hypothetical protein